MATRMGFGALGAPQLLPATAPLPLALIPVVGGSLALGLVILSL